MKNEKKKQPRFKRFFLKAFAFLALTVIFVALFGTIFSLIALMIAKNTDNITGNIIVFSSLILTIVVSLAISLIVVFFSNKFGKFGSFVKKNWEYFLFLIILTIIFVISIYYSRDKIFEPTASVAALEWAIFAITIAIFVFTVQHQVSVIEKHQVKDPKKLFGFKRFDQIRMIESIKNGFLNTRITIIFIFINATFLVLSTGTIALSSFIQDLQLKSFLFLLSFYLTTNSFLHVLTSLISSYTYSKQKFLEQDGAKNTYNIEEEFIVSVVEEIQYSSTIDSIEKDETINASEKEEKKNAYIKSLISLRENNIKKDANKQKE